MTHNIHINRTAMGISNLCDKWPVTLDTNRRSNFDQLFAYCVGIVTNSLLQLQAAFCYDPRFISLFASIFKQDL